MADDGAGIWIVSTRGPDDEPVCEITWGPLQWYSNVADVRETALELMTCAAYAEMMKELITGAGLSPGIVQEFASRLLSGREKRYFGAPSTMELLPAGGTENHGKRRVALVLLHRGSMREAITADKAREMASDWLTAAEATESDQVVSEALRAIGVSGETQDALFGYLRQLRKKR